MKSVLFIFLLFLISCTSMQEKDSYSVDEYNTITELISFDDEVFGRPGGIHKIDDNTLMTFDYAHGQVVVFSTEGELLEMVGSSGEGPGEFHQMFSNLIFGTADINVLDQTKSRISTFSKSGEFIEALNLERTMIRGGGTVIHNDHILYSSQPGDEGLLRFGPVNNSDEFILVGESPGDAPAILNMVQVKEEVAKGEIPVIMQRSTRNAIDKNGNIYIAYQASTRILKYNQDGDLLWDINFELDEKEEIYNHFVEVNKDMPEASFMSLRYISDIIVYDDKFQLNVPLNYRDSAIILEFDLDGNPTRRIEFPKIDFTAHSMVYDDENDRFFVINNDEASLLEITR